MSHYDTSYPPSVWEVPPGITSLNPSTGVQASSKTIAITGSNFTSDCTAKMGTNNMTVTFVDAQHLTATIASLPVAGTYQVTVTNSLGVSNNSPFVVTATELGTEAAPEPPTVPQDAPSEPSGTGTA